MSPDTLSEVKLTVTAELVAAYADIADDHNPIHFHDRAAQALGFPGRIAHGMIGGAVIGHMLVRNLGAEWALRGRLELAFIRPVVVGTTVVAGGGRLQDGTGYEVWAKTDQHEQVIVGTASLDIE